MKLYTELIRIKDPDLIAKLVRFRHFDRVLYLERSHSQIKSYHQKVKMSLYKTRKRDITCKIDRFNRMSLTNIIKGEKNEKSEK